MLIFVDSGPCTLWWPQKTGPVVKLSLTWRTNANGDDEKALQRDFKAKVALEAIRGDLTLAELGAKHGIHHTMIASWKRQAIDGMASTFSGASEVARAGGEAEIDKLHSKIG
jgi:transposase